ncbi:MAG: DUF262 domain-containing protein [Cyanobacteria bacterium P01_G01_bin.4]
MYSAAKATALTTFDISKEALLDLLQAVKHGRIQLPDFQRSWVWDDSRVRGLLSSVSLSYPIGTMMLLNLGDRSLQFKPRAIDGVLNASSSGPGQLILDGQQRLTGLFQSLLSGNPTATLKSRAHQVVLRWYYLDIEKALAYPQLAREDAVVGVTNERIEQLKSGGPAQVRTWEFEAGLFPLQRVFDYASWRAPYSEFWQFDRQKLESLDRFESEVIKRFEHYQVPVIQLRQGISKEAVCHVFEKVNTANKTLTSFDLLTAAFAAENFALREDWTLRKARLHRHDVLAGIDSTHFLQAVTLVASYAKRLAQQEKGDVRAPAIRWNRHDVLRLSLEDYRSWSEATTIGFEEAARFLQAQQVKRRRDVAYPMQSVALAAIFASLGNQALCGDAREKLVRWYWCGVFSERYAGGAGTRVAHDLLEVSRWLGGGALPSAIAEARLAPERLVRVTSRKSAIYRGLVALLLREGVRDWSTGNKLMEVDPSEVDCHHVFPKVWCEVHRVEPQQFNSVVNRTPILSTTNRLLGHCPPSVYIEKLEMEGDRDTLNSILQGHSIDTDALRSDRFEEFFEARLEALLELVRRATVGEASG